MYSETGEYYSAYNDTDYDEENSTYNNTYSSTNNNNDGVSNQSLSNTSSTKNVAENTTAIKSGSTPISVPPLKLDEEDDDGSEMGRSPMRSPGRKVIFEDDMEQGLIQTKPLFQLKNREDEEESQDPSLPGVPPLFRIDLPVAKKIVVKPSLQYATLSRALDLKHPCSPRLTESRQELIEYQKVIGLQTALFNLRVDFWKIENSRLTAIENYRNLANEAGFTICENCKHFLKHKDRVKKYGNYHAKRPNPNKPSKHLRYKCTKRTYDEHILNSSLSKYYPHSLEKK